jgi:flagellar basal body rod protein FlgB
LQTIFPAFRPPSKEKLHKKIIKIPTQEEGLSMNMTSLITDNIAELLVKIIEFTQHRQKILIRNLRNIQRLGFVPKDLAVEEFCSLLNIAIDEHLQNQRLLFCDTDNIKFAAAGKLDIQPTTDTYADKLLKENLDDYLELQINKLLENALNQKIAVELLRQKQETISIFERRV